MAVSDCYCDAFLLFDYFVIQGGLGKENRQGKLKGTKWSLILLAAYGGLAFLSTLRSEDTFASQNGMVEQFESIWVLMSYLVVALYSFFMIREKNDVSFIFKGMCIFLGVQCVIGLPQMFGFDLFQSEIGKKILLQKDLSDIVFQCYERNGISYVLMEYQDITWRFTKDTPTGEYGYINIFGKLSQIENAKSVGFANKLNLFSGRGYIWSRTLPLLRQHIFIGSGPDTFIIQFPQNDYVAKASLGKEFFTQMITRAHSMYLQMGVQTGVLSALCFVLAVGIYIFVSIRLFCNCKSGTVKDNGKNNTKTETKRVIKNNMPVGKEMPQEGRLRLGVVSAIMIYLIMGITNDSMIVTAPIFWTLWGVGMSLNHIKIRNSIA